MNNSVDTDKKSLWAKEYHQKNKIRLNEKSREYYLKNKEKNNEMSKAYYLKNFEILKIKNINSYNKRHLRYKESLMTLLGGECIQCGFKDIRALKIEHINGERIKEGKNICSIYKYLLTVIQEGSQDYQLLCANCNWIKRFKK